MAAYYSLHTDIVLKQIQSLGRTLCDPLGAIEVNGRSLDLFHIIAISRYGQSTRISNAAHETLLRSFRALKRKLANGDIIYGVNTGFGGSADTRPLDRDGLQHTLMRELAYGILPPGPRDPQIYRAPTGQQHGYDTTPEDILETQHFPSTWSRATVVIRINSLVKGYSAVRTVIIERLQDLLTHQISPMIPIRGSISASGDLSPLGYVTGAIIGKSIIRTIARDGQQVYADVALRRAGLEPVKLVAKEGLALVNGTAASTAAGALALYDVHGLALLAQVMTAMSVEALHGSPESFHPFFADSRPHPSQMESARNILCFLQDSQLTQVSDGKDGSLRQDRYSIRTAPQWLGPALEDLTLAHQQVVIECNSATDNPLIDADGNTLHGGNFQAKAITSAMEKTRQAAHSIGRMLYTQCTEMINPATNRGLPPNLIAEDPSTSMIFKGADIHIAALQSELGYLSGPANHVQSAEMGNQALNSLALIGARYTHTAARVLAELMAVHLVALCQAVDLRAMHIQFMSNYHPEFSSLLAETLGLSGSSSEANLQSAEESLWQHLWECFDSTTNLDPTARFAKIAREMKARLMELPIFESLDAPLRALSKFQEVLATSLQETWCPHRDAYMLHGDATPLLGAGSRVVYGMVRRTLKVPFLCTPRIRTPSESPEESSNGHANGASNGHSNGEQGEGFSNEAPTVGSFHAIVFRSIRDGRLVREVAMLLEQSNASRDSGSSPGEAKRRRVE